MLFVAQFVVQKNKHAGKKKHNCGDICEHHDDDV